MGVGGVTDDSAEILFQSFFFSWRLCEQFWHGQGCPVFDSVRPAFPLPVTSQSISACPSVLCLSYPAFPLPMTSQSLSVKILPTCLVCFMSVLLTCPVCVFVAIG